MSERPEFDELVGGGLEPEEEARLRRVHELLVAAGPPPELPPTLAEPPAERRPSVAGFPVRRRLGTVLVLAAALLAAAFGGGYLLGDEGAAFHAVRPTISMHGSRPTQLASIEIGGKDAAGNWPLLLRVRGLRALPRGGYYELVLTRNGTLGPSCGSFRVSGDVTQVVMNAPYRLSAWNGWVVVEHLPGRPESAPILST